MADQTFKKDVDYPDVKENYVIEGELTVKITLAEYRELVSAKALKDKAVKDLESEKYEMYRENEKLKKQNEELKHELYELQKRERLYKEGNGNGEYTELRQLEDNSTGAETARTL